MLSLQSDDVAGAEWERRLNDRVDILSRDIERLGREVTRLEAELRAFGVQLPALNPSGRTQLSVEARRQQQQLAAARARAGKRLGAGAGRVRSPVTAARLMAQYERLCVNGDETCPKGHE